MSDAKDRKEKKRAPKLRFPGFGGEWKAIELGEFLEQKTREIPKPNTPYKAIGIRSHFKGTFQKPDSDPDKIAMVKLFVVKQNDLIVNITFAWEGAVAMATAQDNDGLVSHRFPTYIFDEQKVSKEYFRYVFPTKRFKYILTTISPGGAGRNRVLNKKDFKKIEIKLPALAEQKKISNFLDSVNKWMESLKDQKEKLEAYKKGIMQKIFSQEIRFKDDNGDNFPEWEEKRLGELGIFKSGNGFPHSEQGGDQGVPFFKVSDMNLAGNEFRMIKANNYVSAEQIDRKKFKLIKLPSIVFAKVGAALFLERKRIAENFLIDNNMMALIPNGDIIFFKYLLDKTRLSKYAQMGALPSYSASDLKIIKTKMPSLCEQQKIADFLTSIDNLIKAKQTQIIKAKSWKKGLMQQLFV